MLAQRGVPLRRQVNAFERPAGKINLPPKPRKSKRAKVARMAQETLLRRRAEHFRVLAAIAELLPRDADVDGRATGTVTERDIAATAGTSRKAVTRALLHWQSWRVLWIYRKGSMTRDIRFQRAVVEEVLATRAADPRKVVALLFAHQARRKAEAPWPRVQAAIQTSVTQ